MTLSLYSTYKAWKKENAQENAQENARENARNNTPDNSHAHARNSLSANAAQPHAAMRHEASAFYAAFAAMGCGLGGMACADTMESRPI